MAGSSTRTRPTRTRTYKTQGGGRGTKPARGPEAPTSFLHTRWGKFAVVLVVLTLAALIGNLITGGGKDTPDEATATATEAPARETTIIPPLEGATSASGIVPIGYQQNEDGAVAAATNYLTVLTGSTKMLNPFERDSIIQTVTTPDSNNTLQTLFGPLYDGVRDRLGLDENGDPTTEGSVILRVAPWAYSLGEYDGARATVNIWHTVISGVTGIDTLTPLSEAYATATLGLEWANGDWKITSFTSTVGPAPLGNGDGPAADIEGIANVMTNYTPYTYGAGQP